MSIHHRWSSGRTLQVEGLETRKMLAGDVLAEVVDGNLRVSGDVMDNQFSVHGGAEPGQVIISGNDTTLINGQASATFDGVRGNILIRTGAGNDSVSVQDLHVRGTLRVNTGIGDDHIGLNAIRADNVVIHSGGGDDHVSLNRVGAGGLHITTGEGSDRVAIRDSRLQGPNNIHLGDGMDSLAISGSTLHGPTRLAGGGDHDVLSLGTDNVIRGRFFTAFERTVTRDLEIPTELASDVAAARV